MKNLTQEAKLYLQGKTVHEIGKILLLSGAGIWKRLKKQGIKLRSPTSKGRPWAIKKRGKEFLGADGRWWIRGIRSTKKRSSKRRAVVIMESKLGGYLIPKGFHVHHLDGNEQNDNSKNLMLLPNFEHMRITGVGPNPKKSSMKGKKHNMETITKMSIARKRYWKEKLNEKD